REYTLSLVEDQYYGRTDGFAKGLIGTVRGDEIVRLIGDPEFPQEVDDSLFEDNIRLYWVRKMMSIERFLRQR
ncbi:hypothetical protein ACNJHR_21175, partial [Mycobacterium tuberculosis]